MSMILLFSNTKIEFIQQLWTILKQVEVPVSRDQAFLSQKFGTNFFFYFSKYTSSSSRLFSIVQWNLIYLQLTDP